MIEYPSPTSNLQIYRAQIEGWDIDSSGAWARAQEWMEHGNPEHYLNAPGLGSTVRKNNQLQELPEWRPLADIVEHHARIVWNLLIPDEFRAIKNPEIYVIELWTNYTKPGYMGCGRHDHACPLVGTYYPEGTSAMGPLIIYEDDDDLEGIAIDLNPRELILFPGTLSHSVGMNATDQLRRAVAVDIAWRSAQGSYPGREPGEVNGQYA